MSVDIRRLRESDIVTGFKSGDHRLDNFLRRHALANARASLSATWVAVEGSKVVGYVTVAPGSVGADKLRSVLPGLPNYPAPVLLLARIATQKSLHGRGVGRALLGAVYAAARHQAELGCAGVATDAKPGAVTFYEHVGFVTLCAPDTPEGATLMFLPMRLLPPVP